MPLLYIYLFNEKLHNLMPFISDRVPAFQIQSTMSIWRFNDLGTCKRISKYLSRSHCSMQKSRHVITRSVVCLIQKAEIDMPIPSIWEVANYYNTTVVLMESRM